MYRETGATRPGEAPRYDAGGARYGRKGSDTAHSSACGGAATLRTRHRPRYGRACVATRPGVGYDTTTTRCLVRHDTADPACSVRAARVRWVCILCTQLSFDSGHCFESLFGVLFMNTVHEHCSRDFRKINK